MIMRTPHDWASSNALARMAVACQKGVNELAISLIRTSAMTAHVASAPDQTYTIFTLIGEALDHLAVVLARSGAVEPFGL